jgi:aspartyl-tRNA(Asn)/glutamyl-tRNA(Gln) amidotransferase subunit C
MAVTREQVERMAALARLRLSESEITMFASQLAGILAHAAELEDVEPQGAAHEAPAAPSPMRDDVPCRDELAVPPADIAPEWDDGFFTLPRLPAMDGHDDPGAS